MSELMKYKFSDLYSMSSGISSKPEQAGHGAPFLSFRTVFQSHFLPEELEDKMHTSDKEQKIYSIKKGDVFLTRTSETIDELGMSSVALKDYPTATYSGFLKRIRPIQTNVTYHKYLAFYLRSKLFRKTMTNNAIMTLRASLNEHIFSYLDLLLPSYPEQKKIGDFLHLLNQKIELNNRINQELEGMAKLLYDYWFVQFDFPISEEQAIAMDKPELKGKPYKFSGGPIVYNEQLKREVPEGWEANSLSALVDCNKWTLKKGNLNTISYLETSNLTKNVIDDLKIINCEIEDIPSRAQRVITKNDVLYSTVRPQQCHYGIIKFPEENLIASSGFAHLRSKNHTISNDLIYCFLTSDWVVKRLQKIAESSVSAYPSISPNDILKLQMPLPQRRSSLNTINNTLNGIYTKIGINLKENKQLTELRDWLLPMLMNGQVRVGEVKKEYENDGEILMPAEEREEYEK